MVGRLFRKIKRTGALFVGLESTRRMQDGKEIEIPGLLSNKAFLNEIETGMLRSERTGSPMTIVLFSVEDSNGDDDTSVKALKKLGGLVCRCSRRADSKGWYRRGKRPRIGLLLHHTAPERAARVIREVSDRFGVNGCEPLGDNGAGGGVRHEIFAYPADGGHGGNGSKPMRGPASGRRYQRRQTASTPQPLAQRRAQETGAERDAMPALRPFLEANRLLAHALPVWKRGLDVVGALTGLLLTSPIFLVAALAIKLTSTGPIFFKQQRIGYLGKPFEFWKFRTMRPNANAAKHRQYLSELISNASKNGDEEQPMRKLDAEDDQITPIGRFLRMSCIDELPQLINVLRGQMSLVGPRPCLPYEAENYQCWHNRRFDIVPGMTGLWQVKGKNRTGFREMIRLDINYIRNCSLWLDVKILLMTVPTVISELRTGILARRTQEVDNA